MTAVWSGTNPMVFSSSGDTSSRAENFASVTCASFSSGRDVVFALTAPFSGPMSVQATPSGWDAVLYARTTCSTSSTEFACRDSQSSGKTESFSFWADQGITYYVIVDGYDTAHKGAYSFTASISQPVAAELCPGKDLSFTGSPPTATETSDISNYWSNYIGTGTCANCSGAKEAVYHFVAPQNGTATISITPTGFDAVLYVRNGSCAGTSQVLCKDAVASGLVETGTVSTTAGADYWVFVDSCGASAGAYTLKVKY
jgi:hypothetical protein